MASSPEPPVCVFCRRRPVDPGWRPFCSERCKTLDLARWADGTYRVPGEPVTEEADGPTKSDKQDQ
jgi:endogenous inhibitor of DNA gyrase (YacG/DUF329 family)